MNRRKKDSGDAKSAADAAGRKDDKKAAKKPAKKGKRGREASTGTSVPVRLSHLQQCCQCSFCRQMWQFRRLLKF